jgi:hypothetical protein
MVVFECLQLRLPQGLLNTGAFQGGSTLLFAFKLGGGFSENTL